MKPRSAVILFAVLLITLTVTGAAAWADDATPQASAAIASSGGSDVARPSCSAGLSAVTSGLTTPEPTFMVTLVCGSCSLAPCVGVPYNSSCQVGTRRGTCLSPLGDMCSALKPACQCWSGPLP